MSSSIPSTMKAIVIHGKDASVESDRPIPKLRDDYILVKVNSIALNPTDWKHIGGGIAADGSISGCDASGTVVQIGPKVTKSYSEGDRVAVVAHGANYSQKEDGVFAEYAVVKGDVQMKIPDSLSFEKAATVSLGAITCGQGLFQKGLKLPFPGENKGTGDYVLVYGGATATGTLGIQLATLAGYKVITTNSPKHNAHLASLGAVKSFNYSDPDCAAQIKSYTNNKLYLVFDTIGLESSAQICADALSTTPNSDLPNGLTSKRYATILRAKLPRDPEDVAYVSTMMYTMFGEEYEKGGRKSEASIEDYEFAKKFMKMVEGLLADGSLKTHAEEVRPGGLQGALQGMEDMKAGKISGTKLVFNLADSE